MNTTSEPGSPERREAACNGSLIDLDGPAARHWRPGPGALARFLLLIAIGLLLVGVGVDRLAAVLDWRPDGPTSDKLALLQAVGAADIYFVGTSHTLRAVDPTLVDQALAEQGCQGHSLNLGAGGATVGDMAMLIDQIETGSASQVLVVTEGGGFRAGQAEGLGRPENAERHADGLDYLAITLAGGRSNGEDWIDGLGHVLDAVAADLGRHRLHDALFERGARQQVRPMLLRAAGYVAPEDDENAAARQRHAQFLRSLAALARPGILAQARAALAQRSPALAAQALALVARIRAGGGQPVLLLLPAQFSPAAVSARNALALAPELPAIDLAIDRDILPFPDPDYFYDSGHVARQGAIRLSRMIGEQLCALLKTGR